MFGIQASCSTVWDTVNSIDTIRIAGGWERASWDGAAWFAPRGRAGWGMRRKMIANLNRYGWTVRDRAEAAG